MPGADDELTHLPGPLARRLASRYLLPSQERPVLTTLSVLALVLASACWMVGDALIVGFRKPDSTRYSEFIAFMGDDTYAFYTRVNDARLRAGALVADYAAPLWLVGLYSQWLLLRHSPWAVPVVAVLGVGFVLQPLAHAAFYPVALASERVWTLFQADPDAPGTLAAAQHARRLRAFLLQAWVPSVGLLVLGWLAVAVLIATGQTPLPWWAALLTPVPQALPWSQLPKVPYPGRPLLDGALFNTVSLVWGLSLLFLSSVYPLA